MSGNSGELIVASGNTHPMTRTDRLAIPFPEQCTVMPDCELIRSVAMQLILWVLMLTNKYQHLQWSISMYATLRIHHCSKLAKQDWRCWLCPMLWPSWCMLWAANSHCTLHKPGSNELNRLRCQHFVVYVEISINNYMPNFEAYHYHVLL